MVNHTPKVKLGVYFKGTYEEALEPYLRDNGNGKTTPYEHEYTHVKYFKNYYKALDQAIHMVVDKCISYDCYNAWVSYYDIFQQLEDVKMWKLHDQLDEDDWGCWECGQRQVQHDADIKRLTPALSDKFKEYFLKCEGF